MTEKNTTDIKILKINPTLPKDVKIIEYANQLKNPYQFKYGKFSVTVSYANNGITLKDCLISIIIWLLSQNIKLYF